MSLSLIDKQEYIVKGKIEKFPGENGWYFVRIPLDLTAKFRPFAVRGLVAVEIDLGSSRWKSSLLPYGDGSQFIPLSKKIRENENLSLGQFIGLRFKLRES